MTWVVATVTSILYPAITKYEERVQSNTYPVSDESDLSSDSSSFCSTCSEGFTYRSYTAKTYQADPCTFASDMPVKKPPTPLKPPSAHVERTVIGQTYEKKGQSVSAQVNYNKTSMDYSVSKIGSSKSDSHLLTSLETCTKKSKDATTETESLEIPLVDDKKAKAMDQMKNLKNVFVNFKCHLKGETQLILESIFQEIMSDLSQAIPSLSSVTAEVFVDQTEAEREELLSNVDICSVASEIVENMLEKLESAVEKKCVQIFSQEDVSIDIKPNFSTSGEYFSSVETKPSEDTLNYTLEPMCDIADDMVHTILEKLMILASCKKNEVPPEDTNKHFQQTKAEPIHKVHQQTDQKKTSPASDPANLILKEEIQNLISNIFSQSSLVGYVEEAISTILGYVQTELNNERLIASEETVVLLQLLDDVLTQLHQQPVKVGAKKHKRPRVRNLSDTEEKYRLTGTRSFSSLKSKRPFPPVNVPGMVFYSEDDEEEIDNFVQSVLDSSFSDEKAKSQEQFPDYWPKRRDTCFEYKRSNKLPTKSTYQNRVGSHDWGLKLELSLSSEDIVKTKHCLSNEASIFSQDQKHQIQKASENIVKHILTEMLKDISSDSSSYLGSQTDKETSDFFSEKSQGLSDQEWMEQIFSGSEICAFAHEITDSVINILNKASTYIPNTIKNAFTSVHHTCIDPSDTAHTSKETSSKKVPYKVWFDSEKKMKYLSSLNVEHEKTSQFKSGKCEPKRVNDITDKIINTIFKRLKLFVCPKLQIGNKSSQIEKSLHSQLSTYTMKIVNIVLHAIQSELEINKINPNLKETDLPKCHKNKGLFTDSNKVVESHVTSVSDDIMESPLLTCICEMITSTSEDKKNTSTCTDKVVSTTICRSGNVHKQNILSNKQDKDSFCQLLAKPCLQHSFADEKDFNDSSKLEVLGQIGETLHEMLRKLTGDHPDSQPPHSRENREMLNMDPPTLSNTQLISKAILEYILAKLCDVDIDTSNKNSGLKTVPELLDIDNLSFASTMEEMAKCTNIISNIISKIMKDNNEVSKSQAKNDLPMPSKAEIPEVICSPKLKTVASDILSMVFAKLENFASERVENVVNDDDKKDHAVDWECESNSSPADSHDKSFQSTLYSHAKKVSNGILKAIQTELNMNSPNCKTDKKSSPEDTQMLTNIVDLILDVVSEDVFAEPESENQSNENYGYRPTYGNFLPGGAESDSFLDDDTQNKELIRDTTSFSEETRTLSTDQMVLERTLSKIEVKLKEPHRSPIVPIIRNILNEIFQNALISQLNVVSLSRTHFSGMPHNTPASSIQTFAHSVDQMMGPLVSDTDVSVVVNDVVRTVFHKLYSAAMTEKYVSENRCKTIIFSANVSFHEHTYGGNAPVSGLNGNACDLQPSWNVDKQTKINVVEDIVQAILENLETFAASKVESFFYPQTNFTVPVTLPVQQEVGSLSQAISGKDSYSDNQLPYSVDHSNPEHIDNCSQMSLSKLNIYAKEVARKILQGIKHELDKEQESPLLTNNIMVSENIASQVVNTVLDIVSCKSKSDKNSSDKENYSDQQVGIIERLVNKTEYRKILEFQIQDTIEGILCDIYENIMYQNNLSFATPTLKYGIPTKHSEANFEPVVMGTNIIPKVSVPKADVILVSKDIVDIVLHNLTSLVMLAINAKDSVPARLTIYDIFPKSQGQQPLSITQRIEGKPGHFSHSKNNNLAHPEFFQMPENGKEDTKEPAPEACEQNANCITETIFNRLQSFATERINSLMTLAFQSKGNVFVSPQFENGKDDNCIFQEPGQAESDVNVLKLSTTKTVPGQELAEPIFARFRENFGTTTHLSQTSLKGYAAFIASTILKLIKNDLDLEIQSMHTYSNHILFQKNMIVCEIVNSILKILHNKESVKEFFLSPSENSSCSQLTMSHEVLLGYKEKEKAASLPQFTKDSLEENQITVEKESQRDVLEEIFMRKGESKPREKTEILRTVEEVLTKLSQKIMEIIGHIAPFNEMPYIVSKSKSKTAATTWKKFFQSHINNVSNDILENVLGEMHSVVVTSLYKKNKSRREGEIHDSSDSSSGKPPGFRETKPTRKSSALRLGLPQMHPYADNLNALVLENTFLPYSPLQIGKYLVQIVLDKLSNFVSLHLEEGYPPEGSYDDLYLLRLHNSKLSPKNSPRPGCKTSLKMRSKITSLSKFKTKPHLGISCTKTKNKTKLSPGEKTPRENRSKTALGLPQTSQAEDAKTTLKTKLPVAELRVYATNIITDILEVVMSGLERAAQHRAMFNTKVLASSQILEASKIVSAVLQELYATNKLASPDNISNLSDHRLCKQNLGAGYSTEQPCFYLENVSSQLEQIFPKEGILKKMFDKWQTETSDTETEKSKLLTIAENILAEISIKAKDLEYSLSLLNLPPLEECENRFYDGFKGVPTRAEDTKAQINMFGREIVEMLFEKLQLCFLSQMPTQDGNRILTSRKGHVAAKSKHGVPTKHIISGLQTCNMKTKDQVSMNASNQIVHEIVERVLNMLESFVDLKFKNISKYEFSEIVKMPIDNLFQVQQRQLSKKMLPKAPFRKCGDESKSSTVMSKENVQDTLLQVHLFHSELLTYSVTTVSGMLRIIKNKLDKEISQMEPSPVSILKENIAASEIIGTLIDQCSHFGESLIKNLPTKNWFKGTENVYIVNQVEFAPPVKMPPSNTSDTVRRSNSPSRSVSGLEFTSDDGMKEKYSIASNSSSHISSYVENTGKSSEPMGRPNSKVLPTCSRQKAQDHGWRKPNSAPFEEVTKPHSFLPEGSVLQKLFKKVNNSTEESLKQVLSFIEMGKGENPRVFHYETTKSAEPNEIKTTASPLKICLAAENIVNTVLSSYGFPHQVNTNESMETMKPFFMSRQNPLSEVCEGQKDTEKTLLTTWCSRTTFMQEEESGGLEACQDDFSLLHKWKNKNPQTTTETLEETDTIVFADHELGPNEMHLVARHITASVITHLKNFKTAGKQEKNLVFELK